MDHIKKYVTIGIVCVLSHIAFANTSIQELQQKLDRTYITTPNGTCGAYTASARPILNSCNQCCGSNWNLGASLLYWQGKTCGTEYAYRRQNTIINDPENEADLINGIFSFPIKGDISNVASKWNSGFQIALGYNIEHDGWETNLCHTRFSNIGSDKIISGCNDNIFPTIGLYTIASPDTNIFIFCTEAKSQTRLHFHTLIWDIARDFFISDCLSIRPFTALEAGWITTRQITRYTGGIPIGEKGVLLGLNDDLVVIKENCAFKGLGPVMGLGVNWYIGRGLSIFNEFTIGALYGKFQLSHSERYSANDLSRVNLKTNYHKFSPMAKYMLGLAKKCYFNDDQNHLTIKLAFESQYWWRVNQVIRMTERFVIDKEIILPLIKSSNQAFDLSIIGVTFNIRLDF